MSENNNKKLFKYRMLAPLWIAIFIDVLGFTILFPMVGYFSDVFNTSQTVIGLVFSVNAMFGFVFGPILSKLSDKYGRKPLLLISQFGTCLAFILTAFSNTLWMLIIARMIDGMFGGNFPIAKAIISDKVPPKDRGIQMANVGIAHVLASLIGPAIGGFLFTLFGLLGPGLFAAGLTVITIIVTLSMLEETWPKEKRLHNQQSKTEIIVKVRQNKNALFMLLLWGFHTISFTIVMSSISFFSVSVLHLNPLEVSFVFMISGIFRTGIRFTLFKPTIKKLGESNAIRLGLVMFFVSFFIIGFSTDAVMVSFIFLFISFAASLTRGPMNSKISQTASPKEQGKINGFSSALDSIAQIIGPLAGAFILDTLPPYWLGIIVALIALPAMVMSFQKIEKKKYDLAVNLINHSMEK
ncbi:MAG: MFS transporter [Candidatus Lokiarchaeota archaeon]|nr:MFS transporter [Candidatus Lokiarchaeota archaeon]